ncbi:hypothetical protein ACFL2Q_01215, partial [Thermodesulfobacteriota bacterium]
ILNLAEAGPQPPPEAGSGFRVISGNPVIMDIYEILYSMEGTPVPVRVSVTCEEGTGEIFRNRHHVLHAHVNGKATPYKAMAAIVSWTGTHVLIRDADKSFTTTLEKGLTDFFTDSLREIPDEIGQVLRPGELPEWELSEAEFQSLYHQIMHMGVADKVKLAFTGNKEARGLLIRDTNKMVSVAVVKSPKIQEAEIEAISKNRSIAEDVLRQIAATKEWMKSYSVKNNLCNNSKTPLPIAMKLVPTLRDQDLRKLGKSKNVPSAVATHARRIAEARQPKRG